tara:strand:- start:39866 stop:40024 length:159 start_codon:yes stop_codon:yes gene_type:complete
MKIYFVTWLYEKSQEEALYKSKGNSRLLSYYHIAHHLKKHPDDLKNYLKRMK